MARNDDHRTELGISDTFICEDAASSALDLSAACIDNVFTKTGSGKSRTTALEAAKSDSDECWFSGCKAYGICNRVWSEGTA